MVKRAEKLGTNLVGAYCPSCGTTIFMQPGVKQCSSCKALIGMDVWIETPPPLLR
jgi:uncharacterized OB-fold protein